MPAWQILKPGVSCDASSQRFGVTHPYRRFPQALSLQKLLAEADPPPQPRSRTRVAPLLPSAANTAPIRCRQAIGFSIALLACVSFGHFRPLQALRLQ